MLITIATVAIIGVSWFVGLLMGVRIQSRYDCAELGKLVDELNHVRQAYRSHKRTQ